MYKLNTHVTDILKQVWKQRDHGHVFFFLNVEAAHVVLALSTPAAFFICFFFYFIVVRLPLTDNHHKAILKGDEWCATGVF